MSSTDTSTLCNKHSFRVNPYPAKVCPWCEIERLTAELAQVGVAKITEKCIFCETRIEVPEPNQYSVICGVCRQRNYEAAWRLE